MLSKILRNWSFLDGRSFQKGARNLLMCIIKVGIILVGRGSLHKVQLSHKASGEKVFTAIFVFSEVT